MGRRTWSILILLALAATIACLLQLHRQRQDAGPVVEGRHLSEWVDILGSRTLDGGIDDDARRAISKLGTNSFPYLLKWIQSEETPWRYKLPMPAVRFISQNRRADELLRTRTERRIEGCHAAFSLLRTNATPDVIAELTKLMNASGGIQTQARAVSFLSSTGAKGLPSLIPVLQNPRHPMRFLVVRYFYLSPDLHAAGQPAVPALIECLKDSTYENDVIAAAALGKIKAEPELTVPALIECLESVDPHLRRSAASALASFPETRVLSRSALVELLSDPDPEVREAAASALQQVAPEALATD